MCQNRAAAKARSFRARVELPYAYALLSKFLGFELRENGIDVRRYEQLRFAVREVKLPPGTDRASQLIQELGHGRRLP